jgi:hypothetical protein
MADLIALKFSSGIRTVEDLGKGHKKGHAEYPDLNQLSSTVRRGMDWCEYIDAYGLGIQYDKDCGHKEHSVESPRGQQCCVIVVEPAFAAEAMVMFPSRFTQLTPAEFEDFYDNKAHAHEPDEHVDTDVLDAIESKERLGLDVPEKANAIDRTHKSRGIRENKNKTWARKQVNCGHTVV